MRYSEALDHLYSLCECVNWDPEITHGLITIENELHYRQCMQKEQKSVIEDTKGL